MTSATRSSMSAVRRSRRAWRASTWASNARFTCHIGGCHNTYKTSPDLARHKWTHLPEHLLPTCPFTDSFGVKCPQLYWGRPDVLKLHWAKEHGSAGPFPSDLRLPYLREIIANYNRSICDARPFTACASHSSYTDEDAAMESDPFSLEMPPPTPSPVYPGNLPSEQAYYSPNIVQEHFPRPTTPPYGANSPALTQDSHHVPAQSACDNKSRILGTGPQQEYYQLNGPSSSTNANSPDSSQYFDCPSSPSHSALDVTGYSAVEAQYAQPFIHELGSPDWEFVDTSPQSGGTKTPLEDWHMSSIMDLQEGLSTLHL